MRRMAVFYVGVASILLSGPVLSQTQPVQSQTIQGPTIEVEHPGETLEEKVFGDMDPMGMDTIYDCSDSPKPCLVIRDRAGKLAYKQRQIALWQKEHSTPRSTWPHCCMGLPPGAKVRFAPSMLPKVGVGRWIVDQQYEMQEDGTLRLSSDSSRPLRLFALGCFAVALGLGTWLLVLVNNRRSSAAEAAGQVSSSSVQFPTRS